jgi:hypothetical protein
MVGRIARTCGRRTAQVDRFPAGRSEAMAFNVASSITINTEA